MGEEKKKTAKDKFIDKNSTKNGILSVVGAIMHKIGISAIWVLANLATYLISYLRQFDKHKENGGSLSLTYAYFFGPILSTTLTGFMPICGVLEFKLGVQRAVIVGGLVIMLGYSILFISKNIFLDMFATFLFGIGLSISTTLSTKNALMYFFNQKGTIGGILELISSGFSASHNKIAEYMINPGGDDPSVPNPNNKDEKFYPEDMSEKVLNFYLLELGTYGVSTLLTLLFLVPYDQKAAKKLSKELKKKSQQKEKEENTAVNEEENTKKDTNPDGNLIVEDYTSKPINDNEAPLMPGDEEEDGGNGEAKRYTVQSNDNEDYGATEDKEYNKQKGDKVIAIPDTESGALNANPISGNLSMSVSAVNYSTAHTKKALKSFRVWKLFILNLCYYLALNLILTMWRPVGMYKNIPTGALQNIGTINFIMTSVGTPFFGFLADKLPFRILYCIIGGFCSLIGFTFCFSFGNKYLFAVMVCGMNFILGGFIAGLPPHYMKVFGMKYYVEIGGVIGLASLIMGPLCAFFAFFVENNVDNKDLAYKIIFNSGAALNIVSIVIAILESDDEFEYGL